MTDRLTLDELNRHVDACVSDFMDNGESRSENDWFDLAWELAEGSECVIYTHKARQVIDLVELDERDAAFEEMRDASMQLPENFDQLLCSLAFFILRARFDRAIQAMRERVHD